MKFILSTCMVLTFTITANIYAEEAPKYEPNVAEYYVSSFKEG